MVRHQQLKEMETYSAAPCIRIGREDHPHFVYDQLGYFISKLWLARLCAVP